ncbi:unnamed protein product [Calicophoron daubneyi]|uniref:EF-hand domain-containing protein n=1 Tax=Calicophoron daubneyi TaxID=300641 RepID=A0AAV2TQJ8_CALDB
MRVDELKPEDIQEIRKCFSSFDPGLRGYIKSDDFGTALRCLKLMPTEMQIGHFINALDPNQTGRIKFEHFMAAAAKLWVDETTRMLDIWNAFFVFDKENTGVISSDTMKKILTVYGLEPVPLAEANKVIRSYANKRTGMIEYGYLVRNWLK